MLNAAKEREKRGENGLGWVECRVKYKMLFFHKPFYQLTSHYLFAKSVVITKPPLYNS